LLQHFVVFSESSHYFLLHIRAMTLWPGWPVGHRSRAWTMPRSQPAQHMSWGVELSQLSHHLPGDFKPEACSKCQRKQMQINGWRIVYFFLIRFVVFSFLVPFACICNILACSPSILRGIRYILAYLPSILHAICYILALQTFMYHVGFFRFLEGFTWGFFRFLSVSFRNYLGFLWVFI
jgi:hypothetical protein